MRIIGLTGPSGSGKGCCGDYFRKHGIPCIDTDKVYHELLYAMSPCTVELTKQFGSKILNSDGSVDRKTLASLVFSDNSGRSAEKLNRITHKYVLEKTVLILDSYRSEGKKAAVIDAPLLFEAEFDKQCDFCIAVLADQAIRLKRIIKRDGISLEKAMARIHAQKTNEFYSARASYTVWNNNGIDDLYLALDKISIAECLI